MPYQAALILAAALCLTVSRAVQADCHGHDLFPALKSEAPAAYAAIETAASAMPFRHGKLFRLSRAGSEPSYLFATLHLSDPRVTSLLPRLTATLTNSKIVVLETVETGDVLRRAVRNNPATWRRATLARENQRADNLLSKTDFKQLESLAARRGLLKSVAREFKASSLALLLDLSATKRQPIKPSLILTRELSENPDDWAFEIEGIIYFAYKAGLYHRAAMRSVGKNNANNGEVAWLPGYRFGKRTT